MSISVQLTADKLRKRKKNYRIAKGILAILLIVIIVTYFAFNMLYQGYNFTVSLDANLYYDNNVIIYDDSEYKTYRQQIKVESLERFDNISHKWLPTDLDDYEGSHNGENYLAYSFYIENMGENTVDYYNEIIIDDVIKNVDEAIRIRVYFNGEPTTYAKLSARGVPEEGTVAFESKDNVMSSKHEDFKPGDKHKYTIVMWIEGSDLECTNNIIGGEFKAHMEFNSEFKD